MTSPNATEPDDAAGFTAPPPAVVAPGVAVAITTAAGVFVGVGLLVAVGPLVGLIAAVGLPAAVGLVAAVPPLPTLLPHETSRKSASAALDAERQAISEHLGEAARADTSLSLIHLV